MTRSAAQTALEADAMAVVVFTKTGVTAEQLSDERPYAPILAFSPDRETLRKLALYWGVHSFACPQENAIDRARQILLERQWATSGEKHGSSH